MHRSEVGDAHAVLDRGFCGSGCDDGQEDVHMRFSFWRIDRPQI